MHTRTHSCSHTRTQTCTHTHTTCISLITLCRVTNLSRALGFGLWGNEKMKERGKAVVHWQLRGSHPHPQSLISLLISPWWPPCLLFGLLDQARAQSTRHLCNIFGEAVIFSIVFWLFFFTCWTCITGNMSGAPIRMEKLKPKWTAYASNLIFFFFFLFFGFSRAEWLLISQVFLFLFQSVFSVFLCD